MSVRVIGVISFGAAMAVIFLGNLSLRAASRNDDSGNQSAARDKTEISFLCRDFTRFRRSVEFLPA